MRTVAIATAILLGAAVGACSAESNMGLACEDGDAAAVEFSVTLPEADPPLNQESDTDTRSATCMVETVAIAGNQTTLDMSCDEASGATGQAYVIEFIAPAGESPFGLAEGTQVDVEYERWWGFEVGTRTRIALSVADELVFLAYDEGLLTRCTEADNSTRAGTEAWLERVAGELALTDCAPTSSYGVRFADETTVFPGQVGDVPGTGLRFVLEAVKCQLPEGAPQESYAHWGAYFATWTPMG